MADEILSRSGVVCQLDEFADDAEFFYIAVSTQDGGFEHSFRTRDECAVLLARAFPRESEEDIESRIDCALIAAPYAVGGDVVMRPEPSDAPVVETDPQDVVTDLLLDVHREHGMKGVKSFLRMAVANFSAEAGGSADDENTPDDAILDELAEAIKTPVCEQ